MSMSTPWIREPAIPRHYGLVVVEVVAQLRGWAVIVAGFVDMIF